MMNHLDVNILTASAGEIAFYLLLFVPGVCIGTYMYHKIHNKKIDYLVFLMSVIMNVYIFVIIIGTMFWDKNACMIAGFPLGYIFAMRANMF